MLEDRGRMALADVPDLDRRFRAMAAAEELSGAVLVTHAGETVLEGCYGLADRAAGTPVTPRTRFATASLSKMFTAAAVLDLAAEGALRLDEPLVDVLPPERRPSTLRDDVTAHHLLSHTSGIADYFEEDEDTPGHGEDYGALWRDVPCYCMERPVDFLPLFGDLEPYRPPGERFQYSNAGFVVLALLVEELTGRAFTEVVEDRVLTRAGMRDSAYLRSDSAAADVAVGYLPRESTHDEWRSNVFSVPVVGGGDGGAHVTARDVDRFLSRLEDGTLLGPMQDAALTAWAEVPGAPGLHHGYGVFLYPDGRFGHGGGDPGVEVMANRWPDDAVSVVVLCNVEDGAWQARDAVVAAWRGE